ncbi:MAG: RICIN domain-containing protein [Bryobacterales bacterium]|nr:RICIN domain-containing protein [Bryobacterales bacterium]
MSQILLRFPKDPAAGALPPNQVPQRTAALLVFLFTAAVAAAHEPIPGYWYRLQVKHSGLYLGSPSGNVGPNAPARQVGNVTLERAWNQSWTPVAAGGGWFRLQSLNGSYLDVTWASKDNNAPVGHAGFSNHEGGAAQLWKFVHQSGGWYRLQVKHSQKYLDVTSGDMRPNAPVAQSARSAWQGGAAQLWQFVPSLNGRARSSTPAKGPLEIFDVESYTDFADPNRQLGFLSFTITQDVPVTVQVREDGRSVQKLTGLRCSNLNEAGTRYSYKAPLHSLRQSTTYEYTITARDLKSGKVVSRSGVFRSAVRLANPVLVPQ